MDNAGVVEFKETKITKTNKSYNSLKISGEKINDFEGLANEIAVGDRVTYSTKTAGTFLNLTGIKKLPKVTSDASSMAGSPSPNSSQVSPAFFGMVYNKSIELTIAASDQAVLNNKQLFIDTVAAHFEILWNLAENLKKSKGVQ